MARDFAKAFYKSKAWQQTRNAYGRSRGWLCEECIKAGLYKPGEIVHHRTELTPDNINNPGISLAWGNLKLVCRECHAKEHGHVKRYRVDDMGRVII